MNPEACDAAAAAPLPRLCGPLGQTHFAKYGPLRGHHD